MNEQDTIRIQAQLDSIRADLFSLKTEKELEAYVVGRGIDDFFGTANSVLPSGGGGGSIFSFKAAKATALTATMLAGGITLGPFTRIEWASITSASLSITVDDATAEWFVWLDVDVRDGVEAASWHEGADMASYWSGLTDEVKKYTTLVPLVQITATDKSDPPDDSAWSIDEVKNLQCGDVYIPRL